MLLTFVFTFFIVIFERKIIFQLKTINGATTHVRVNKLTKKSKMVIFCDLGGIRKQQNFKSKKKKLKIKYKLQSVADVFHLIWMGRLQLI